MKFSNKDISHKKSKSLEYLMFNHFSKTNLVKHCFTTRLGGVSTGEFESLNLKYGIGDNDNSIINNYKIICDELEIDFENVVNCNQIHSDIVEVLYEKPKSLHDVDAFITNVPNIAIVTNYADCVPLLFLDPIKKVIGNSHAGWKGTLKKIGQKTVQKMVDEFFCQPKDILVGIGPSIGQCCFETSKDVFNEFKENFNNIDVYCLKKYNKYYIDLWEINKIQLKELGILEENIVVSRICTSCQSDYFFSYRTFNGKTGRMGSIIELI